jgi:hypothetical protein
LLLWYELLAAPLLDPLLTSTPKPVLTAAAALVAAPTLALVLVSA